jgi:hypothetical protein
MKFVKFIVVAFILFILFQSLRFTILPFVDSTIGEIIHADFKSGSEFKTKEECEKNKGDWGKAGLFPKEFCRMPADDFEKLCITGFQCQTGICLTKFSFRNYFPLGSGRCPKYSNVFGCTQQLHFGFKDSGICRD